MTEMEMILKYAPGQIVGHDMFDGASRWRIAKLVHYSDADEDTYRLHVLPIHLGGLDKGSTRSCTTCGREGCTLFVQLDKVILYNEEGTNDAS